MPYEDVERDVLPTVARLNGPAMKVALGFDLHACTDITGFGIAGHALEVALGSGTSVLLHYTSLPFYPGALDMYKKGENTGSNKTNREMTLEKMDIRVALSGAEEELLFDPQTSGGLLLSVPDAQSVELLDALSAAGVQSAVRVGEIVEGSPGISVV
jgi:selenide,water dikinase